MLFYSEEGPRVCVRRSSRTATQNHCRAEPPRASEVLGGVARPIQLPHRSASFEFYQATHKFRTRQADLHRKVVDADPLLVS